MPHIKINQPNETCFGTTIEIDGKKTDNVRSINYSVSVDRVFPEADVVVIDTDGNITMHVLHSEGAEVEFDTDCINLDISPANLEAATDILRYYLSKDNPHCKHLGIVNELRKGFLASIKSALEEGFSMPDGVTDDELAEKILDRLLGEEEQ